MTGPVMSSKQYAAGRQIQASSDAVWSFLTDARALVAADTGITRIEGDVTAGGSFKLWSEATGDRAFAIKVTEFDSPHRMVWSSGMPLGLFRGIRTFAIATSGDGCSLEMDEVFSGLFSGPITKSMPDLTPLFERFVEAAKQAAEATA